MGVIAWLADLAGVEVEDAAAEAGKDIFDLEVLERLVLGQHLIHQVAQRRHVPLMLAKFRDAPSACLGLRYPEHGEEGLACRNNGHVAFKHDERVADRVDDALRQLPGALALLAGRALLADVLDCEQDGAAILAGTEDLACVDQHGALANGREVMLDLEAIH